MISATQDGKCYFGDGKFCITRDFGNCKFRARMLLLGRQTFALVTVENLSTKQHNIVLRRPLRPRFAPRFGFRKHSVFAATHRAWRDCSLGPERRTTFLAKKVHCSSWYGTPGYHCSVISHHRENCREKINRYECKYSPNGNCDNNLCS